MLMKQSILSAFTLTSPDEFALALRPDTEQSQYLGVLPFSEQRVLSNVVSSTCLLALYAELSSALSAYVPVVIPEYVLTIGPVTDLAILSLLSF